MKEHFSTGTFLVLSYIFWGSPLFSQSLHLTNTINNGRHITDIVYTKLAPYTPLIYAYKSHPSETAPAEVMMVSDVMDSASSQSSPPTQTPAPTADYAVQLPGIKTALNLGAGEFPLFLNERQLISERLDDSIYKAYTIQTTGLKCTDSIIRSKLTENHSVMYYTTPGGKFYLAEKSITGTTLTINFYDSTLHKITTIQEQQPNSDISFADDDRVLILNWTKESVSGLVLQEYSLAHGKLFETKVDMPGSYSSYGVGSLFVNDTLIIVYAQMFSERETAVYAINPAGKIYWKTYIQDYTDELHLLKGANKLVCSFYNLQETSTLKFYSLLTGKWQNTVNMQVTIPEFALRTKWPVYLPLRLVPLPSGKWIASLVNCYSPDNTDISNYYLLVSNGVKTFKTKLRKTKSITSTNLTALSDKMVAVTIDDDIYYYSITEGENKKAGAAK